MKRMKIDLRDIKNEDTFYDRNHRNKQNDFYKRPDKNTTNKKQRNKPHTKFKYDDDDFDTY